MNRIQYRKLLHGEEQISILGVGTSSIQAADEREIEDTSVRRAFRCLLQRLRVLSVSAEK